MASDRCRVCGKTSDGARYANVAVGVAVCLCGTDFDAWLASSEHGRGKPRDLVDFIDRRQAERRNSR